MSDITKVTGQECLNYINKNIGFGSRELMDNRELPTYAQGNTMAIYAETDSTYQIIYTSMRAGTRLLKVPHDTSKRIVGYVRKKYDDGGLEVVLLGNETIARNDVPTISTDARYSAGWQYRHIGATDQWVRIDDTVLPQYVPYEDSNIAPNRTMSYGNIHSYVTGLGDAFIPFDDAIDFHPPFTTAFVNFGHVWRYRNIDPTSESINNFEITNNENNTLVFGVGNQTFIRIDNELVGNPLSVLGGNLYTFLNNINFNSMGAFPDAIPTTSAWNNYYYTTNAVGCENYNLVCIPYNIVLTDNIDYAKAYLNTGTLPPDAYLYPLDWENLPTYQQPDDDGGDGQDDNTPDDNTRDVTPNPPVIPSFTPSMLTNNNYYWLTAPELAGFISWYWNDVGNISDIDDLLAKIEGLYNNLSQAILNIRFMPVEVSWIGGTGAQSNIKIAQIEKDGLVDTLSKTGKPTVETIGTIHIPNKYNSFVDLSPYSQLSVYLPYHGFLDLDMNIFSGHDLTVKAIYDYMSGTIQYLLYYDNQFLVNTIICKMAMDIPISLQTKNDRDSAVFQNVSNVVGGLMGAGLSLGTGNPMGLLVGANALNSGVASAPLNVKGNVGEQGAFYAPPQCSIILRRPTISKPSADIWKSKVGQICGKSYTLANLSGYTTVYNPQITFSGNKNADNVTMKPLQSEIEEIYSALEKGVII